MHQMSDVSRRAWLCGQEPRGARVRLILMEVFALAVLAMAAPVMAHVSVDATPVIAHPPAPIEFRDCDDCPQMVRLPGGTFQMGDTSGDEKVDERKPVYSVSGGGESDNKPVHSVTLGAFAIGKYEVTRGEYAAFTRDSGRAIGGNCYGLDSAGKWEKQATTTWQSPGFSQSDREPVACISWEDAKAYVAWLSQTTGQLYRLLSESEWEYAARGGSTSKFWWGNDGNNDHCGYANARDQTVKQKFSGWADWSDASSCNDGHLYTAPVGSYRPNGFGLFDMAGNVWEWVEDCYAATYNLQPRDGAAYTSEACPLHVFRGGAWDNIPGGLGSAYRRRISSTGRFDAGGFRVARAL